MAYDADAFVRIVSANFGCPHRAFVLDIDDVLISGGGFRTLIFDFDSSLRQSSIVIGNVQTQGMLVLTQDNALPYYERYTDMPIAQFLFYAQNMYQDFAGRFAYGLGEPAVPALTASGVSWGCIPHAVVVETLTGEILVREVYLAVVDAEIELKTAQELAQLALDVWKINLTENQTALDATLVCEAAGDFDACVDSIGKMWSSGDLSGGGGQVPIDLAIRAVTSMNIKFIPTGIIL